MENEVEYGVDVDEDLELYELDEADIIAHRDKIIADGGEAPGLQNVLDIGEKIRQIGLTPLYATAIGKQGIYVTTEEKVKNRLH
jgi:hypothetical protein